jgi:hypothetical protein
MQSDLRKERDESYRRYCDEIAWREGFILRAEGNSAYIDTADGSWLLCQPSESEHYWYEVWLALKYKRPDGAPQPINKVF